MASENEDGKQALIKYLRDEAYAVRDCFTRSSIQVLAVAGGLLVAIARFQIDYPYIGIFGFFPIVLIFVALQMGVHKYATSNRLLGYELHLQRTAHYASRDRCNELIAEVGWEESMRAWRVVQPTIWHSIYEPRRRRSQESSENKQVASFVARWRTKIWASLKRFMLSIAGTWISSLTDTQSLALWVYPIAIKSEIERTISSIQQRDTASGNEEQGKSKSYTGYWFDQERSFLGFQKELPSVQYNAGGYLRTMMVLLLISVGMCLCLPTTAVVQSWSSYVTALMHASVPAMPAPNTGLPPASVSATPAPNTGLPPASVPAAPAPNPGLPPAFNPSLVFGLNVLFTLAVVLGTIAVGAGWRNIDSRIRTLESGLSSIHSSAILWEATVLAHLRALDELHFFDESKKDSRTMHGYSESLAKQASHIAGYVTKIHQWIDEARRELDKRIEEQKIQTIRKL